MKYQIILGSLIISAAIYLGLTNANRYNYSLGDSNKIGYRADTLTGKVEMIYWDYDGRAIIRGILPAK